MIESIAAAASPYGVLDALQGRLGLNALAIRPLDDHSRACFHGSAPPGYSRQYLSALQQFGEGPMLRYAKTGPLPFTFTEARRKLQPAGRDNWTFDLLNDHGMRDGVVVPQGDFAMVFWSERILSVSEETRMSLNVASAAAIHRLKQLMPKQCIRIVDLSPRELAVLEHLAQGRRVPRIARRLDLTERTVREYLQRARRKLDAATPTQAVFIAVRKRLI